MTDAVSCSRSLQSEYEAKLAADLEQNGKERERVTSQLDALAAELQVLEQNRTLLLSVQQAVGVGGAKAAKARAEVPTGSAEERAAGKGKPVAPRQRAAKVPAAREANGRKASKVVKPLASSGRVKPAKAGPGGNGDRKPSLVQLVRDQVTGSHEPRSAAEVAVAVSARHPERSANVNGVRMALESLVAKAVVQRSQQGRAVFYERVPEPGAGAKPTSGPELAEPALG